MGNLIVVSVLFIFCIGCLSLVIDSLNVKRKPKIYPLKNESEATVVLKEDFEIDLDKLYK